MAAAVRSRCYYCKRFISFATALMNHRVIQHPNCWDPEAYEISYCDSCAAVDAAEWRALDTYVARSDTSTA